MRSINISKIFANAKNSSAPCCGNQQWGDPDKLPPGSLTTTSTTTQEISLVNCVVILNYGELLYAYNPGNNQHIPLGKFMPGGGDIANTLSRLWFYNGTMFYEYNIQLSPFYAVFSRTINGPLPINNLYVGLHALDNTHLITSDTSTTPNRIVTLDISGDTAVEVDSFALPEGKLISGDIIFTTNRKVILTTDGGGNCYLYQYDYDTKVMEIAKDLGDDMLYPYGLYEFEDQLYIVSGPGRITSVSMTAPHTLTVRDDCGLLITGASQFGNCITKSLTP